MNYTLKMGEAAVKAAEYIKYEGAGSRIFDQNRISTLWK
jgi:acetyl/propionyl-CoA carboxylase alpha subunit